MDPFLLHAEPYFAHSLLRVLLGCADCFAEGSRESAGSSPSSLNPIYRLPTALTLGEANVEPNKKRDGCGWAEFGCTLEGHSRSVEGSCTLEE